MPSIVCTGALGAMLLASMPGPLAAQDDLSQRVDRLAGQVQRLELRIDRTTGTTLLVLFGAFCALWAQNTNRNPWLWFFAGLLFNVIAVLVLLAKNAGDQRRARGEPGAGGVSIAAAIILGVLLVGAVVSWRFMGMR